MRYTRMPIEIESPEQMGYGNIRNNLTESSFSDIRTDEFDLDLKRLLLCYGDHVGNPELRGLIAADANNHAKDIAGATSLTAQDILLTPGAAGALFIINTTLLEEGDTLLVEHPNYGTNIETPRALGANVELFPLTFEEGFRPNLAKLESAIQRTKPKVVSITTPHNPTGVQLPVADLQAIVAMTKKAGAWLLVDETYRDMAFGNQLPVAATLGDHVMSVSSFSKTYGLPGIRLGWVITRNKDLQEKFLAAKEQIVICGSVVDEEIGTQFYRKRDVHLPRIRDEILAMRKILKEWFEKQDGLEWVEPEAGVVCFPRIKDTKSVSVEKFHQILNAEFGTFVGPGHWFEMDRRYMRIGYAWPKEAELRAGLEAISKAIQMARH
jgi:aspartate/methionine/tyrosine aminotransferase